MEIEQMVHLSLPVRIKLLYDHQELVVQAGQAVYQILQNYQNHLELQVVMGLLVRQGLRELPGHVECQVILDIIDLVSKAVCQKLVNPQDHQIVQKLLDLIEEYSALD